ncbi:MAG TPA: class B sortase, partial [Clostridiales bacterium]|nr:class B sortase [Clostridiales bacterium]
IKDIDDIENIKVNANNDSPDDPKKDIDNNRNQDSNQDSTQDNLIDFVLIDEPEKSSKNKKSKSFSLLKVLRIFCIIGFFVFSGLFVNEVFIQPAKTRKVINITQELYKKPSPTPSTAPTAEPDSKNDGDDLDPTSAPTPTPDPNRDEQGRLLQFKELLALNEDVKGWITVPETNIDYVVLQPPAEDPEFYLRRNIYKENDKAGSLFLDYKSSIEEKSKNLVIHGHNMTSTDNMFHYLLEYKKLNFYKERPVITFDHIYDTGEWKIISVFITNGSNKKEEFFDYTRTNFEDKSDFLNFVYQLRVRSVLNLDTVDVNEEDQLLTLSTCSYELDNYRTVVVARKVREGEDPTVDVESVKKNKRPLYPELWYKHYGGNPPVVTSFEEALEAGEIHWYQNQNNENLEENINENQSENASS